MQQLSLGNNSAQTELWQRTRAKWVSDIHQTIDGVGKASNSDITPTETVSFTGASSIQGEGRKVSAHERHSLRARLASRDFNGQVSKNGAFDEFDDFKLPVPKEQSYVPGNAYAERPGKNDFLKTEFNTYAFIRDKEADQTPPSPYGGGFKNTVVDGLADFGSTVMDVITYGFRDITASLFGSRA
ncbi:MAG: hypothetical protein LWY06_16055 [Firmicutes bacterium]|nr:hypothetical protein [Bacillota bacterium]